jgi:hypothetical protein
MGLNKKKRTRDDADDTRVFEDSSTIDLIADDFDPGDINTDALPSLSTSLKSIDETAIQKVKKIYRDFVERSDWGPKSSKSSLNLINSVPPPPPELAALCIRQIHPQWIREWFPNYVQPPVTPRPRVTPAGGQPLPPVTPAGGQPRPRDHDDDGADKRPPPQYDFICEQDSKLGVGREEPDGYIDHTAAISAWKAAARYTISPSLLPDSFLHTSNLALA